MSALERLEDAAIEAGLAGELEWWRVHRILELVDARAWLDDWEEFDQLWRAA